MVAYGLALPWVSTLDRRRDCNSDKMERCVIRERGHQTHVFVFTEMGCVGIAVNCREQEDQGEWCQ